jgi:hypothetical protein
MEQQSKYAVPMAALQSVKVPADQLVEEQDVHVDRQYMAPEELDRARLLSSTEAGRLHIR